MTIIHVVYSNCGNIHIQLLLYMPASRSHSKCSIHEINVESCMNCHSEFAVFSCIGDGDSEAENNRLTDLFS